VASVSGLIIYTKKFHRRLNGNDPENRLVIGGGPINSIKVAGAGMFDITTKGALTNGASSLRVMGFWGLI
jgi:aldehyde:ferredoxin oxidoreductase